MGEWKKLFYIFWTFFKISPATFGGGYAMVPLIIKVIVERNKWLTTEEVTEVIALSQTVPGAVAVNSATFIGHKLGGIKGALAAMLGVSLPTFLIVLTLGISYLYIHDNSKLEAAFTSIRITIVAIIAYAAIKIAKTAIVDKTTFCIMIAGVLALFFIHPIVAIFLGSLIGLAATFIKKKIGRESKEIKHNKKDDHSNYPDYFMGAGI
ncbi:chromate transporter [Neobacillus niacini]|uniref:chromate transporter n=1 Tax=Neobacillus niacini TaxID=86668 RepID=UPI002864293C|nr:chromate transporter [Neobacillus niacini]MDR7076890.1 chromate transporter [Neobacillus niacini]